MRLVSSAERARRSDSSAPWLPCSNRVVDLMKRLLLGTRNPGKVKEITTILEGSGWSFSSLQEFADVGPAAEDGVTYAENAIAKARFYAAATGMLVLADDS